MAYFERFGSHGIRVLEELAVLARRENLLVLVDAKRGDIDTTGEAYAEAFFSPSSPLRVDAVTFHPYMGFGALRKSLELAVRNSAGVFIVVRSSNPEGEELQNARIGRGSTVAEDLCQRITGFNLALGSETRGPIGAVVGATCHDAGAIAAALPQSFLLAPGVGAQGATLEDMSVRMAHARSRLLPSVSRAILSNGCGPVELRESIRTLRDRAFELL
jgi:orotidine-5'-phosphate decarboxylase